MMKLKRIKPLGDSVITTANREDEVYTSSGLLDPTRSGGLKQYQTVLFVSDMIEQRNIKEGDVVMIDFDTLAFPTQKPIVADDSTKDEYFRSSQAYNIHVMDIDGKECLNLRYNNLGAIILEMVEDTKPVIEQREAAKIVVPKLIKL